MNVPFFPTSRRRFLVRLGLLAATPSVAAAGSASHLDAPSQPDWLRQWSALPRLPVTESRDPIAQACLRAASSGGALPLYYHGGRTPGRLRKFSPELLFHLPGRETRYVSGYCHLRQAPRILRLDRISPA